MKTVIYYFSSTGNSLKVAKDIGRSIGECELVPIVRALKENIRIIEADRVGFVFPLYYLSFPKVVKEFIEQLEFKHDPYIFSVITRGFRPMGGAISEFKRILKAKGTGLDCAYYLDMPNNDIVLFDIQNKKKQTHILEKAHERLNFITNVIKNGQKGYSPEPLGFMRPIRYPVYVKKIKHSHKAFRCEDTCNGCGICAKVCTLDNIIMHEGKPQWQEGCQECEGCINLCPQRAIQYGTITGKKGRYKHPEVSINDIALQKA